MKFKLNLTFLLFTLLIQGGVTFAMEQVDIQTEKTILNLLSFKFSSEGDTLTGKIEKFKEQQEYTSLSNQSISRVLERLKLACTNSSPQNSVVLYIPSNAKEDDYKDNIVACAYYPWELDSQSFLFSQTSDLGHIHIQLAYALHYGHPLAASELNKIANSYYLPELHKLYQVLKSYLSKKENWDKIIIPIKNVNANAYTVDQLDLSSEEIEVQLQHFDTLTSIIENGYNL